MLKFTKCDKLLKTKEEELQTGMAAQFERIEQRLEQEVAEKHDLAERLREKAKVCEAVEAVSSCFRLFVALFWYADTTIRLNQDQ